MLKVSRPTLIRLAFAVFITVAATGLVTLLGDLRSSIQKLTEIDPIPLFPIVGLAVVWQVSRAIRIGIGLKIQVRINLFKLYHATALHMFFSSIMPMRTGELALPYFLKKNLNVPVYRSVSNLVSIRIYDLFSLLFIAGLCIVLNPLGNAALQSIFWYGCLALCASSLYLAVGPTFLRGLFIAIFDATGFFEVDGQVYKIVNAVFPKFDRHFSHISIVLLSLLIWCLIFLSFYLSLLAVDKTGTFDIAVLSGSASSLSVAQPINGVAGLGVVQLAWTATATWLGLATASAITSAILHHIAQIFGAGLNACVALILRLFVDKPTPDLLSSSDNQG